jgi:hypothetical protein
MRKWRKFRTCFAGRAVFSGAYKLKIEELGIHVTFTARKTPLLVDSTELNQFCEGLWRADCGELWLASEISGRYIEINIAPNGAWWSCVFTSPRIRDESCSPPICQSVQSTLSRMKWECSAFVSWQDVHRCLCTEKDPVGNVTLVLLGCPDVDPPLRNLHSIAHLGAHDFHRPQDWVPLSNLI